MAETKTAAAKKAPAKKAAAAAPAKKAAAARKAPAAAAKNSDDEVLARFLGVDEVTPKDIKRWQIKRGHLPTGELTDRQWAEIRAAE